MSHRRPATRSTRARLAAVGGVLAALTAAGCSVTNPITTHDTYASSDGLDIEVGELRVGNALVLASEEGGAGTFLGFVTNRGAEPTEVTISVADDTSRAVRLGAGETASFGTADGDRQLEIASVPARPGSLVEVTVSSTRDGETTSVVPVLDGTLPPYDELVP